MWRKYAYQTKALNKGTSFRFKQSAVHKEYLFWLYEFFHSRGYCMGTGPREYKTILIQKSTGVHKTYYGYEFDLFTFSSLNWIYDLFYKDKVKTISPECFAGKLFNAFSFSYLNYGWWRLSCHI